MTAPPRSRRAARAATELYVSGEESGEIIVVDVDKGEVAARIPVGKRPRGIKLSRDGKLLYVALSGRRAAGRASTSRSCRPAIALPTAGRRRSGQPLLLRTLESGQDPESFDLSRDGKTLYVSNEETAEMSVLDLASGKVKQKVPVGREPEGVTVRPDGKVVYVTSESDGEVTAVDTKKLKVLAQIPTGPRPRVIISFTPNGKTAFASCENGREVTVIDVAKNAAVDHIKIEPVAKTVLGPRPMGMALSPDAKTLYVALGRGEAVAVVDVATHKVARLIDGVGSRPWGIAGQRQKSKTIYTANGPSNDVSVVDAVSGKVEKRIKTGGLPWGLLLAPHGP